MRSSGRPSLGRPIAAEFVGTAFLVAAVIGSGVAAQRLSPGDIGGIAPSSVLPFVAAQLVGALLAIGSIRFLHPNVAEVADQVVVPREAEAPN